MSDGPIEDGLVIPEVGAWSRRKYHFLGRYLQAFTTAMKGKPQWKELHYIDLFSGAGVAKLRGSGQLVYSSALLAAQTENPFTQLHLCDANQDNVSALAARLAKFPQPMPPRILQGDANQLIHKLLEPVPARDALCMTFVDPFGLHFDFDTARAIATRRSDLLVLFADSMDALRNWSAYYNENPNSSLDRFMGESGWRTLLDKPKQKAAQELRSRYREQLKKIGYEYFREVPVANANDRDIYTLLFASRAKIAVQIWDKLSLKDEFGQQSLRFDSPE